MSAPAQLRRVRARARAQRRMDDDDPKRARAILYRPRVTDLRAAEWPRHA